MSAQVIPLSKATAQYAARLSTFDDPPTVDALLERARLAKTLYASALAAQGSGPNWSAPPTGLEDLRQAAEFFWERCVVKDHAAETVFAALERSGADECLKNRVRDHFSAFCHSF
jgi:hypothetical protein